MKKTTLRNSLLLITLAIGATNVSAGYCSKDQIATRTGIGIMMQNQVTDEQVLECKNNLKNPFHVNTKKVYVNKRVELNKAEQQFKKDCSGIQLTPMGKADCKRQEVEISKRKNELQQPGVEEVEVKEVADYGGFGAAMKEQYQVVSDKKTNDFVAEQTNPTNAEIQRLEKAKDNCMVGRSNKKCKDRINAKIAAEKEKIKKESKANFDKEFDALAKKKQACEAQGHNFMPNTGECRNPNVQISGMQLKEQCEKEGGKYDAENDECGYDVSDSHANGSVHTAVAQENDAVDEAANKKCIEDGFLGGSKDGTCVKSDDQIAKEKEDKAEQDRIAKEKEDKAKEDKLAAERDAAIKAECGDKGGSFQGEKIVCKEAKVADTEGKGKPKDEKEAADADTDKGQAKTAGNALFLDKITFDNEYAADVDDIDSINGILPGTDQFKTCQRYLKLSSKIKNNTWAKLSKKRKEPTRWDSILKRIIGYKYESLKNRNTVQATCFSMEECRKEITSALGPNGNVENNAKLNFETNSKNIQTALKFGLEEVSKCEVFLQVTAENFKGKSKEDIKEMRKRRESVSFDGKIKCISRGIETVDFDDCVVLQKTYSGFIIGSEANKTREMVVADSNAKDAQLKAMEMGKSGNTGDIATQTLQMQKDQVRTQKKLVNIRAMINSAKALSIGGLARSLPNEDDLLDMCHGKITKKAMTDFQTAVDAQKENPTTAAESGEALASAGENKGTTLEGSDPRRQAKAAASLEAVVAEVYGGDTGLAKTAMNNSGFSNACEHYINSGDEEMEHDFLANQSQKASSYLVAVKAGVDAIANFAQKKALSDREDLINKIIDKVKNTESIGALPQFNPQQDAVVQFCELNPNAPECAGFASNTITQAGGGGISVGGDGFGSNNVSTIAPSSSTSNAVNNDPTNTDGNGDPTTTSRAIASVDKAAGFVDPAAPEATVKSDANNTGSSSSTSASGSAGGLIGSGGGGKGKAGAQNARGKNSKISYSGGNRGVSFARRGGSSRKSKSGGNPFASLFGKKGNNSARVMKFRGTASAGIGGKKGNIFDRISRRYDVMESKNRLLQYKIEK